MRYSLDPRVSLAAIALGLIGLSSSCSSGSDSGGGGFPGGNNGDRLKGTVSVLVVDDPDPGGGTETEPNNSVGQANDLGSIASGQSLVVTGGLPDSGDVDVFRISSASRIEVNLNFVGAAATGADLDVLLVDPVGLQPVERFDSPNNSESGSFILKGTGFLIVQSAGGTSDYTLELSGQGLGGSVAEVEPNNSVSRGRYLGTFVPGENLTVTGSSNTDNEDFFLMALPGQATTFFSLSSGSGDLDLHFYDATTTLNPGSSFASSIEVPPPFLEETSVATDAMTLLAVEVRPFASVNTSWTLQINVGAGRLGTGKSHRTATEAGHRLATLSSAPRGSTTELRSFLKGPVPAIMPTEMVFRTFPNHVIIEAEAPTAFETARGTDPRELIEAAIAPMGGEVVAQIPDGAAKVRFELPAGLSTEEAERYNLALCASLSGHARIAYAEPDFVAQPTALQVTPDDTFYEFQWHYEQIQLPAAWGITTGSNAVRVAVLDTGTTPSMDLQPREVSGFDMISNVDVAGDGDGVDSDPRDVGDGNGVQPSSFHGSHVAGTIGAATNNNYGVAGVTWETQIMHVRVLGIGGGSTFDITNAMLYAAGLPNSSGQVAELCHVQNLSLGGGGFSQSAQNAINDCTAAGSLIIAAAGNENSSTPSFPAAYDNVVSVAAVDFNRDRAPYSNFHPTVDIAAPGGDVSANLNGDDFADGVLSTKPDDSVNPTNFENFAFFQGTSMAAPHVAGVAALVLSENINLTPGDVAAILQGTATDLGPAGRDNRFGDGLVNAFAAVSQAGGGGTDPSIGLDAGLVLFESSAGTARVDISNVGGGLLEVTGVAASTNSGGNWLSAATFGNGQGGSTNVTGVELTVDAAGLADGEYTGEVQVESNGGNANLQVNLSLGGGTGTIPSYDVFVLAVDVDVSPPETRAQFVLNTAGSLDYALRELEAGGYVIVAGTDEDDDGFICDEGEPLCGLYPSLGLATRVVLGETGTIANLNFPLQDPNIATAAGAPSSGFRLLENPDAPEE